MPAPKKFDEATRERAVRMYRDRLEQHGEAKVEARRQVGALLDINQATIRNWVEAEERAAGSRPAASARLARVVPIQARTGRRSGSMRFSTSAATRGDHQPTAGTSSGDVENVRI